MEPGSEVIFFLIEGESALNSTTIFALLPAEGLASLTLKVATDLDFLGMTGDYIFLRARFDTSSFSLLNCFSSILSIGFFRVLRSNTFLLLILYRYYSDSISSLLRI
jgi:hypothetical protein